MKAKGTRFAKPKAAAGNATTKWQSITQRCNRALPQLFQRRFSRPGLAARVVRTRQLMALTPSSEAKPCPICSRTKDGDCRISPELLICAYGNTHSPPSGIRPGDVIERNGQAWAYTGDTKDGRGAIFTPDKPKPGGGRTRTTNSNAAGGRLARLQVPAAEPPDHWSSGKELAYSADQVEVVVVRNGRKAHYCQHRNDGRLIPGAGPDPWPMWREEEVIKYGRGHWICEAEGAKCAEWFRAGGLVGTSQPGHDMKPSAIEARYTRLKEARILGIAYLADHDKEGRRKAKTLQAAAEAVGLPFRAIPAAEIWPDLPEKGSIDDAPGTASERCAAFEAAASRPQAAEQQVQDLLPYTALLQLTLDVLRQRDQDAEMTLRAEIMTRFRHSQSQVDAALLRMLAEQETGQEPSTTNNIESLDLDEITGMDPLVDGFLPDKDLTLLYGSKGSGKTLAALALAFAVINGRGFLDHSKPAEEGGVLFIASDSGAAPLKAAMCELGVADHPAVKRGPSQRFYVWAYDPIQGMTAWDASIASCLHLLNFVKTKHIRLVVMDSAKSIVAKAGISYLDNDAVTAFLTFLKETVAAHAAVLILSHDGTAQGSHSGAKAWAEVPSMVHTIQAGDNPTARRWRVVKSRMGPCREFSYQIDPDTGDLTLSDGQELIGDAETAVLTVLTAAHQRGVPSMGRAELVAEICRRWPNQWAPKTIDNTLGRLVRAKTPAICRANRPRGHYRLSPRQIASLDPSLQTTSPCTGKEHAYIPAEERVLPTSHGLGSENSATSQGTHMGTRANSVEPLQRNALTHVPSLLSDDPSRVRRPDQSKAFAVGDRVELKDSWRNWRSGYEVIAPLDTEGFIELRSPSTGRTLHARPASIRRCAHSEAA